MFKLGSIDRKRTQTYLSAFFCVRKRSTVRLVAAVAAGFIVLGSSSGQIPPPEVKKPTVHLKGVSVKSLDVTNRTAQTELSIRVDNPGQAFKLKDLSYRLKLNDKQAAEGKYAKSIDVPAHSSATLELPCDVNLSALPGLAWAVIAGGFDVHYELETEFTVPLFLTFNQRVKTSIGGDLSLTDTVSGWTARIKERIAGK